ncbi:hypothetical protein GCM10007874_69440 [Labrys miyagiensis]|uniref:Uncharacterized protein n=1 Tax=Labrys miyagiensis TaxID=346912 RepID=A0ABQ6CUE7_9HYPH|nr:hypothetical protein [Labrys miyagiensis]GLS23923.1 hypothetical protein GCM10007874_69440 [Labrys miyagiensis]
MTDINHSSASERVSYVIVLALIALALASVAWLVFRETGHWLPISLSGSGEV